MPKARLCGALSASACGSGAAARCAAGRCAVHRRVLRHGSLQAGPGPRPRAGRATAGAARQRRRHRPRSSRAPGGRWRIAPGPWPGPGLPAAGGRPGPACRLPASLPARPRTPARRLRTDPALRWPRITGTGSGRGCGAADIADTVSAGSRFGSGAGAGCSASGAAIERRVTGTSGLAWADGIDARLPRPTPAAGLPSRYPAWSRR